MTENRIFRFGPFCLDTEVRRLTRDDAVMPLTAKLFDILLLLVESHGQLVTKEEMISRVWADRFVEENNLAVSICALRRALGEGHRGREYIETVPTRGYRFVGRLVDDKAPEKIEVNPKQRQPLTSHHDMGSFLAVLPFANSVEDKKLDYLVDGITESIINILSRLPQLRILARSSVYRLNGKEIDPKEVGAEFGISALLVGTVRQVENRLIIGVELVRTEDGARLWGERYDRQLSDILTVQQEIAEEITKSLRLKLTGEQRKGLINNYTNNIEA